MPAGRGLSEKDRLKAILDSMDDGIYIVGRDYRIRFVNRSFRNQLGEGRGHHCYRFFGHDRSECEECQRGVGAFGPELRREWYCQRNGRTYEVSVTPIHEPDGEIARLHILRDISERKALERKLERYSAELEEQVREQAERLLRHERLALLGEIATGLAHEIRTPLGAIVTGIKLLEREETPEKQRRMLFDLLLRETARLESKVSEFLAYARPRLPVFQKTSVASLLGEVEMLLSSNVDLMGTSRLSVTTHPENLVGYFDRDQIKEALLNIGTNALQMVQAEGGDVAIDAGTWNDALEITVRDNGPGIPGDVLPHVFKPFFSRRPGGTGLGLAISKDIVEAHGGTLTVSSLCGFRTTFRIVLPQGPKERA